MSKHTQGDWEAILFALPERLCDGAIVAGDTTVATLPRWAPEHREETKANARLIAAAPDLLAALLALTEWGCTYTSPHDHNTPHELLIAARAAIAKAEDTDR